MSVPFLRRRTRASESEMNARVVRVRLIIVGRVFEATEVLSKGLLREVGAK